MYIKKWDTVDWEKNSLIEKIKDVNEGYFITEMIQNYGDNMINLSTVEIETVNRCNNNCSFCPVSVGKDIRHLTYMEEELFKKIINDLVEINYTGVISLFSNNEPLIDKRIFGFIKYAKENLPNATHALFTNGLLLTPQKYLMLIEMLDYLVIDNYNDELQLNPQIKEIHGSTYDRYNGCKVLVQNRKKNQILLNRGTLSPNQENELVYSAPCILPYIQMVIRPDGKVSRCCQDAYGSETLGNLNLQSVSEVWNGVEYNILRKDLLEKRNKRNICKNCDMLGLINYFPDYWVGQYQEQMITKLRKVKNENKKIVIYNYKEARQLVALLRNYGIDVNYIVINEDIADYIRDDYFILLDTYSVDELKILDAKGMQCGENYMVYNWVPSSGWVRNINDKKEEISRIIQAAENNKLIILGAGETAHALMGYYNIEPTFIVDSYKYNEIFEQKYEIKKIEDIKEISQYNILIAAADYIPIVEQLYEMGVKASNLIIGINLI